MKLLLLLGLMTAPVVDSVTVSTSASHTVTELNKGLVTSGLGALSGQSAGVTITGANQAAMLSAVRVRGTTSLTGGNDPLVVIDGVVADLTTLGSLYPGDIECFDILKDASETALYGSRGASGVIRVTTRKGSSDRPFTLIYDGTAGVEAVSKNLKMLSAAGFRRWNNAHGYDWTDGGFSSDMPSSILRVGYVQNHHLAFSGSFRDEGQYRVSIGVLDHNTVLKTQKYDNYNLKLDIGQKLFGLMTLDLGVYGSIQNDSDPHDLQHLFYSAAAFNPTFRAGAEPDGSFRQIPAASQINHPVSLLEKQSSSHNALVNSHLGIRFDLLQDALSVELFGSFNYGSLSDAHFFPTIVWSGGEAYRSSEKTRDGLASLTVRYKNTLAEHHYLEAWGMYEMEKKVRDGFYVTTTGFTTNAFGLAAIQAGAERPWDGTGSYWSDIRMLSAMAGATYSYKGRYTLSATLRMDSSSLFGPKNRRGFFPSVSASWVAKKEPFLKDVTWLDNLKFNAGYGISGSQGALEAYQSMELFGPGGVTAFNGSSGTTFGIVRNANPDLRWEERSSVSAGLESSFLGGRLVFTAEYYYSLTRNMLYNYPVSVPPFAFDHLTANLGRMSNSGWEFGLGGTPLQNADMQLNLNLNLSLQRNRLISLSGWWNGQYLEAPDIQGINAMNGAGFHGGHNDIVHQIVGQPLGVFYLPHCTGLARREDGTYYYETDGVNYIAGQASPKVMLGSNISFRYKAWDISVQINGAFGHKIFNGTALTYMNVGSLPYYNVLAQAPEYNISDQTVTDWWLEKGDYVNIDYITLGWNIPVKRVVRNFRLSVSVNNLATLTGYSGLTPMINSSVVGATFGLDDKISYPVYKSYTMALNIQF